MATTADDVWRLLGELTEAQTETERQLQATKQLLQEETQATRKLLKQQNQQLNEQLGKTGQPARRICRVAGAPRSGAAVSGAGY